MIFTWSAYDFHGYCSDEVYCMEISYLQFFVLLGVLGINVLLTVRVIFFSGYETSNVP